MQELEKRPRHYAAAIVRLTSKEERRAALEKVPEHLRDATRQHVMDAFAKRSIQRHRSDLKGRNNQTG